MRVVKVIVLILLLFVGAAIAFFAIGPERVWNAFGDADLGPVEFETLTRCSSPNDSLACPQDICTVESDVSAPRFAVPVNRLIEAFEVMVSGESDLERVDGDDDPMMRRYVQRTKLMRYPDTINVRFVALDGESSTIALYSRSQLGKSDLGANAARLQRWLTNLNP